MNLLTCPWCGAREENEFYCAGDAGKVRPEPAAATSGQVWAEYLYYAENHKGLANELWAHTGGCGQWFILERHTVTHQVVRAISLIPDAPERSP